MEVVKHCFGFILFIVLVLSTFREVICDEKKKQETEKTTIMLETKKITMKAENIKVDTALDLLKKTAGLNLLVKSQVPDKSVTFNFKEATLSDALSVLVRFAELKYYVDGNTIVLCDKFERCKSLSYEKSYDISNIVELYNEDSEPNYTPEGFCEIITGIAERFGEADEHTYIRLKDNSLIVKHVPEVHTFVNNLVNFFSKQRNKTIKFEITYCLVKTVDLWKRTQGKVIFTESALEEIRSSLKEDLKVLNVFSINAFDKTATVAKVSEVKTYIGDYSAEVAENSCVYDSEVNQAESATIINIQPIILNKEKKLWLNISFSDTDLDVNAHSARTVAGMIDLPRERRHTTDSTVFLDIGQTVLLALGTSSNFTTALFVKPQVTKNLFEENFNYLSNNKQTQRRNALFEFLKKNICMSTIELKNASLQEVREFIMSIADKYNLNILIKPSAFEFERRGNLLAKDIPFYDLFRMIEEKFDVTFELDGDIICFSDDRNESGGNEVVVYGIENIVRYWKDYPSSATIKKPQVDATLADVFYVEEENRFPFRMDSNDFREKVVKNVYENSWVDSGNPLFVWGDFMIACNTFSVHDCVRKLINKMCEDAKYFVTCDVKFLKGDFEKIKTSIGQIEGAVDNKVLKVIYESCERGELSPISNFSVVGLDRQRVNVNNVIKQSFVSKYDATIAVGISGLDPVVGAFNYGQILELEAHPFLKEGKQEIKVRIKYRLGELIEFKKTEVEGGDLNLVKHISTEGVLQSDIESGESYVKCITFEKGAGNNVIVVIITPHLYKINDGK